MVRITLYYQLLLNKVWCQDISDFSFYLSIVTSKMGFLNLRVTFQLPTCYIIITITPFFQKRKKNEGKTWNRIEKKDTIAKIWWRTFVCFVLEIWCCKCNTIEMHVCNIEGNHILYDYRLEWRAGRGVHCCIGIVWSQPPASRLQSIWLCGDFGCRYKRPEPIAFLSSNFCQDPVTS